MRRTLGAAAVLAAALFLPAAARGATAPAASSPPVDVVKVQGVIDPSLSGYVRRSIAAAERDGATVVLQLDSRGAYGDEGEALGRFIAGTDVPVITWVGPLGARAAGGALFVVYSSSLVSMAPGAGIGPARPFDLATRASREDPVDAARRAAALQGLAAGSGSTARAIARLVAGAQLPAGPALDAGAARVAASSLPDLLSRIDGLSVSTARGPVTLRTVGTDARPVDIRFHDIGLWDRILHAVSTPTAVYVLLVIGLWGVAFEFTQPGLGMAGIGGAIALALAGYGLFVVPVRWLGLAMLLGGIGLQALDVVVRRVAAYTALGTVLFVAGSIGAWWGVSPDVDLAPWLIALFTISGVLLFGFGFTVALKARERVRTAQLGLVGLVGEARSDLNPEGGVYVKGALWRARSVDGRIESGRRVRVRGVQGLILRVEEEPE